MPSLRWNIGISVLFTLFGGPALVLVYVPWAITRFEVPDSEPPAQIFLAVTVMVVGLVPLFESIARFIVIGRGTLVPAAPPLHLVVTGLYRYVRNPMYAGVLISIAGETLLFRSLGMLEELAAVALAMHLFVLLYEEPKLAHTFPNEYSAYKRQVRRWIPRLSPFKGPI